jgi:outer membrane protein assembly factor BamB
MALTLFGKRFVALLFLANLAGCSTSGDKPKPAPLLALAPTVTAQQVWVSRIGAGAGLSLAVGGDKVAVASRTGTVALLDARLGTDLWRANLGEALSAGVGFDGHLAAVITERNDLVALVEGKPVWRQRLPFASFTAPLVAGQRVFVLGADRSVTAFDGNSGARLWTQSRTGDTLALRQAGVLVPFGDTLLAGLGPRLVSLNPNNGSVRWDVALARPKGANDIERMIDLVGPLDRREGTVCVRAFQSVVGCVDAVNGQLKWTQPADGRWGLQGDDRHVFGTENNGTVVAYQRDTGGKVWSTAALAHRGLGAPLVLGRSVAVGDSAGFVHLLSREDGTPTGRLATDGSPILSPPVVAGDTLLAHTQNGNLFAWRPQ